MLNSLNRLLRRRRYRKLIEDSGLFDGPWYREKYGLAEDADPILHYLDNVHTLPLRPFPGFPEKYLKRRTRRELEEGKNPLIDFIRAARSSKRNGASRGGARSGSPLDSDDARWPVTKWNDPIFSWSEVREQVAAALASPDVFLKGANEPVVSVILPVHNQFQYTLRCVWSMLQAKEATPFELIMSDNESIDATFDFFGSLPGLHYIRNVPDLGFLRSCNKAATRGSGQYLYFLNNDTAVLDNWLAPLVTELDTQFETGLVGSILFYPDGHLQESGGAVWSDGSAWNLGRNAPRVLPLLSAKREVDYVSGAGIMVRRELWEEIGGFDERYVPIYCEDSDLAFRTRQLGYKVYVEPRSEIVHFEGKTSGTSVTEGAKAYQVTNARKLQEKWAFTLERHPAVPRKAGIVPRRFARPRLLIIDHKIPKPNEDAGSVTAVWVMRLLSGFGYDITFLAHDLRPDPVNQRLLNSLGVEVICSPDANSVTAYVEENARTFDAFLLYRATTGGQEAAHIRTLCPDAPIIFFTVDLHFLRHERELSAKADASLSEQEIAELRDTEIGLIARCDASVVLSKDEVEMLRKLGYGSKIHELPLILETSPNVPPMKGRDGICFVGGYQHRPNVEAVKWFVREVWPLVRARLPELTFYVVGSHPPPELFELRDDGVVIVGFVEDLDTFLGERLATVATLTYGAGIKGKIGTSLAVGVPCVCNSIAAEGMGLESGRDVLIVDEPEAIAQSIAAVCTDPELWASLSRNGRDFVDANYSPNVTARSLLALMARVDAPPFAGICPFTGATESRRFDSAPDTLSAGPGKSRCSERVLAFALASRMKLDGTPVLAWDVATRTDVPSVAVMGEAPVLSAALEKVGLVAEPTGSRMVLAAIDAAGDVDTTLAELEAATATDAFEYLAIALYDSCASLPHDRPLAPMVSKLVHRLEAAGLEVRTNRYPTPECAITGTICIEARRRVRAVQ